jgi:osmotically-inducible protein OsmY
MAELCRLKAGGEKGDFVSKLTWAIGSIFSCVFIAPLALSQDQSASSDANQQAVLKMAKEVRKQIVMQPQYGVFDNIHFAIQGDTVILRGQASRPTLKSGIESSVKKIAGVKNVTNDIEVLPLSPNDDQLRATVYRSIYSYPALQRYTSNRGGMNRMPSVARAAGGITNDPPIGYHAIHIVVNRGNVTLIGAVDSDMDLALAGMRANTVAGVFSVDNQLEVAGKPQATEKE